MRVRILFANPISGAPPYVEFSDVVDIRREHGELVLIRDSMALPTVFAARQWVWFEPQGHEEKTQDKPRDVKLSDMKSDPYAPKGAIFGSSPTRKSDESDLAYVIPEAIERAKAAHVQFSIDNRTVPWSEASMRAVLDYERQIAIEYGEETVRNLPWNRVPRASDRG